MIKCIGTSSTTPVTLIVVVAVTSFVIIMVSVALIIIVVIVLLARSRARALKELKLLRESGKKQNVAYEEIKLTPSDINTSENVAYGHISN